MEKIKKPKLLVIGGTGFIGTAVLREAVKKNWNVTSFSLKKLNSHTNVKRVKYHRVDITSKKELINFKNLKFNYIINLGGYINHDHYSKKGSEIIDTHFLGLKNIIDVLNSKQLKKFIQIGSSDEYGNNKNYQNENLRESPATPYSFAKTACSHYLQMLHKNEKFPSVILRLFLTYGPNQKLDRLIPYVIKSCLANKEFYLTAGNQKRDFCYIDDTVNAIFRTMLNNKFSGEIFNVGSGKPVKIKDVVMMIKKIVGKGRPIFNALDYKQDENMSLVADITKIHSLISWKPKISLEKGLLKTIKSSNVK